MDLISIIVPVYNTEKYLKACLESILHQSYENLEIIIVDDGSTDGSRDIIRKYQSLNHRIFYLYQNNQGLASARNTGLKHCHGNYITFIDSDDIVSNNLIKTLYKELKDNNAEISYTTLRRFKTQQSIGSDKIQYKRLIYDSKNALRHYYKSKLGNVCGGLFKRELFNHVSFPRNLIYEDNLPKSIVLYKAGQIVFIEADLYYYRITHNSITTQKYSNKKLDILLIGQKIETYLMKNDENFIYYKDEYYKMIYQMTYVNFRDAIKSGCWDFALSERGISLNYLYRILYKGLRADFQNYCLDFVKINASLVMYFIRMIKIGSPKS
jgi:glycosyltransferase involved in cell wall biosynthesis